jgi:uncharacterized protein YdeI (YjbR/CyaY-like superfamily)
MAHSDPRIDAYIGKSAAFAQPILRRLRSRVHAACGDAEETLKWGFPHFMYRGKILCSMAAFKQHCAFGFWKGAEVVGDSGTDEAMGQFGRIEALSDLPNGRVMAGHVRQAMRIIEEAESTPRRQVNGWQPKPELPVPEDLAKALKKSIRARRTFEDFSPSHRRQYVEWIVEAKREDTRAKRLAQAVEWMAEGKPRNWKYMNC